MIIQGEDGITHINIYSKGKTEIGRWLSNFAESPITLKDDGEFASIEGYWYWLSSKDERLRKLSGFPAKQLGKELDNQKEIDSDFNNKIKNAIDVKMKTYLNMSKILCSSELPICHYYDYYGKKVDAGFEWIVRSEEHTSEL